MNNFIEHLAHRALPALACCAMACASPMAYAGASATASASAYASDSASINAELAREFAHHPLIMVGEYHRSREIHRFLQQLLRDPAFICKADAVVIEFGNARLQQRADDFVAGKPMREDELASLWRETAVPLTWNSPVYRQFIETVREINQARLCPHPIRLLLGDPPLDWSKVKTAADLAAFNDRDRHFAAVVEREVLARGQRALLVTGKFHAWKTLPRDREAEGPTVAQLLERRHPGKLFVVMTVPSAEAARALGMDAAPAYRPVRNSGLAQADFQLTDFATTVTPSSANGKTRLQLQPVKHWPRMGEVVDGLLYLGADESIYPSPEIYLEPAYQQELRRHARIINELLGQDFAPAIDELVAQALKIRDGKNP